MPQTNWSGDDEGPGGDDNHDKEKDDDIDEDFGWGLWIEDLGSVMFIEFKGFGIRVGFWILVIGN